MNDDELQDRIRQERDREVSENRLNWWWLSFCDGRRPAGSQFLGVAVVYALGMTHAVRMAHEKGINPGGEVMSYPLDDDLVPADESVVDKLLDKPTAESFEWVVGYWTTKDGERMLMSDMSDGHLVNSAKMMQRNGGALWQQAIMRMMTGMQPRGDGAQDAFDSELQALENMSGEEFLAQHPTYQGLLHELKKRNLENSINE